MIRAISAFVLAGVCACAYACNESSEGDETSGAVERAQREVARKVERAGEALREKTADGSLLVQNPNVPDGGD